ncbi:MAG TPA: N-acetylgalactosamine-6-sulfatase, partial [Planctomycetaceae bacterium]|nr:N-acetylgalactosamine-6-sulfatase [Planctomycetaceae bacterium]
MRVPLIAAWAKPNASNANQQELPIEIGAIQSQQAAVYDLYPTILNLVEVQNPQSHTVDGLKLNRLLTGKSDDSRNETFLMHYPHSPHRSSYFTSYRKGDWKVIYHYIPSKESEDSHYQLYNLKADPFESSNLASSNPEQLKKLMKDLIA